MFVHCDKACFDWQLDWVEVENDKSFHKTDYFFDEKHNAGRPEAAWERQERKNKKALFKHAFWFWAFQEINFLKCYI